MGNAERNARIVRLVQSGKTYTDVAAKLNVSRNVVAGVCDRAGLKVGLESRRQRMTDSPLMGRRSAAGEARRKAGLQRYYKALRESRA